MFAFSDSYNNILGLEIR